MLSLISVYFDDCTVPCIAIHELADANKLNLVNLQHDGEFSQVYDAPPNQCLQRAVYKSRRSSSNATRSASSIPSTSSRSAIRFSSFCKRCS
mmetsp:Transcript_15970/g.28803  ORF Transcript_15970/g.28803 Transcript_15970/m.28803 type:complete len:92 (-) Transcript_15970:1462-1737(-)